MNMKAKPQLEQSMQEEQIRTALNTHWHLSFAIIPNRASESSGVAICRPCGVIIPASRQSGSYFLESGGQLDHFDGKRVNQDPIAT